MSAVEGISMTTLAELKSRHAARKLRDAPLHKILGPDQSYGDMDQALEMIDVLKETLRDVALHMRANPKHNDELFDELMTRVGSASE